MTHKNKIQTISFSCYGSPQRLKYKQLIKAYKVLGAHPSSLTCLAISCFKLHVRATRNCSPLPTHIHLIHFMYFLLPVLLMLIGFSVQTSHLTIYESVYHLLQKAFCNTVPSHYFSFDITVSIIFFFCTVF